MPTPTNPQDKRYAVSLAFGEWDMVVEVLTRAGGVLTPDAVNGAISKAAYAITQRQCNRVIAKIRAEIPGLGK